MCSFNIFRVIAGSRFADGRTDGQTEGKPQVPSCGTGRGLIIYKPHYHHQHNYNKKKFLVTFKHSETKTTLKFDTRTVQW